MGSDGTLWDAPDGAHLTTLRVRKQEDDLIYANNGDMGTMIYRIVPSDYDESYAHKSRGPNHPMSPRRPPERHGGVHGRL